jgi:hypothetical protein
MLKKIFFTKPTLVSVAGMLLTGGGIVMAIIEICSGNVESGMAAGIVLAGVFVAFLCLVVDRILVRFIKPLPLSLIELVLIVAIRLYFLYDDRALYVNLKNYKWDYFVLIHDKKIKHDGIKSKGLFDTELTPAGRHAFVDLDLRYNNRIKVSNAPESWTSYSPGYIKNIDGKTVMVITVKDVTDTAVMNPLIREELRLSVDE